VQPDERRATPQPLVAKARLKVRPSRLSLGGGMLFLDNEPQTLHLAGHIHAAVQGSTTTLCGRDASRWQTIPHIAWDPTLPDVCPDCARTALQGRPPPAEHDS